MIRASLFAFLVLVSGCSTHPLPLDTTGLNVFDLVHKIQCEAAETIVAKYRRTGRGVWTTLESQVEDYERDAAAVKKLAEKVSKDTKEFNRNDFGATEEALNDAADAVKLQYAQLELRSKELIRQVRAHEKDPEAVQAIWEKADAVLVEIEIAVRNAEKITAAQALLESINDDEDRLRELRTQLASTYKNLITFQGQIVIFQFELGSKEENNLASSGGLKWPFATGIFSVGYSVGDKRTRDNTRTIKVLSSFRELYELPCGDVVAEEGPRLPLRYPIRGKIGLDEVLTTYMRVAFDPRGDGYEKGLKFKTGGESYQDKIVFTTVLNGGVKPSIDITKGSPQLAQVLVDASATRTDTHTLTLYIYPPAEDGDKPAAGIAITRMPALRVRDTQYRVPPPVN